jgi:hypothetical protein
MDGKHRVIKRKATSFFTSEDKQRVQDAISKVHKVVQRATYLIKIYYLETLEASPTTTLSLSLKALRVFLSIVQGNPTRSTEVAPDVIAAIAACYRRHFVPLPDDNIPVSLILHYSEIQLLTAYKNNIDFNYRKYVTRYVLCALARATGRSTMFRIPKALKRLSHTITHHVLDGGPLPEEIHGIDIGTISAFCCVPRNRANHGTPEIHMNARGDNWWDYLKKMVLIDRALEVEFNDLEGIKLFSPLCLASSMIPTFARIDTSALIELLMDNVRVKQFVDFYELEYGIELVGVSRKSDLRAAYHVQANIPEGQVTDADKVNHALRIWRWMCNFDNKHYKHVLQDGEWVFDMCILTDRISINFQQTLATDRNRDKKSGTGRNRKWKKKVSKNDSDAYYDSLEFPHCDDPRLKNSIDLSTTKCVGDDPGKGCLDMLSDGVHTLGLTCAAMRTHTMKAARDASSLKKRRSSNFMIQPNIVPFSNSMNVETYESTILSMHSKKSCVVKTFAEHLRTRRAYEPVAWALYSHPMFRQHKFLVYTKTESCVRNFVNRLKREFLRPSDTEVKPRWMNEHPQRRDVSQVFQNQGPRQELVILYGDWGASTNILGTPPSMGIGLRRMIHRYIRTITTPEINTSKTCPRCGEKTLKYADICPPRPRNEHVVTQKHHLLRCEHCQAWWNRDKSAANRILARGLEALAA